MAINIGKRLAQGDVYLDYAFEDVMFRWDQQRRLIFVKFDGESENNTPVPHDNRLFNDALRFGIEICKDEYLKGRG
jgi:hypothetical protein